jgi:ABC-2 type transport system permease protein/lipopolysaccharide transport system permease protein
MTFTKLSLDRSQVRRYWELVQILVERNLKVRYRGSLLGIYWSLLSPLLMTGLYTAIFGATFASYYDNSITNYLLAAFTGLITINFFSASTIQALKSLVDNGKLLNKIKLPFSIFPLSMVAANVFQFMVGSLPLLVLVTIFKTGLSLKIFAILIPFSSLVLVCSGVGFLVSSLYIFFRDLPYFYELVVFILWISSPVFYPSAIVPDQVKPFLALNPLSPIIEGFRQISLTKDPLNFLIMAQGLGSGLVVLAIGWMVFRRFRHQFIDLI